MANPPPPLFLVVSLFVNKCLAPGTCLSSLWQRSMRLGEAGQVVWLSWGKEEAMWGKGRLAEVWSISDEAGQGWEYVPG